MKRIFTILGMLLTVVVLTLAGAALYLIFGDLSRFKPQLETAISEAAGREFRIAGTFEPEVLPLLSVVAEDFSLANADWSDTAIQAKVGHLTAKVDPWALWSKTIRIEELQLRDVDLLIETGPGKQSNLKFGEPADSDTAVSTEAPARLTTMAVDLASGGVSNLRMVLRSRETGDTVIALESLQASSDTDGKLHLTAATAINENRIELAGKLGPLGAVLNADAFAVDLEGSVTLAGLPQLPYTLAAQVAPGDQAVRIDALTATLGSSDLSGSLLLEGAPAPSLSGELSSTLLDLTEFAGDEESASVAETPDRLFSDAPLELEVLRTSSVSLAAKVERLLAADQEIKALDIDIKLADGSLTLTNNFQIAGGGAGNGVVQLGAAQSPAEINIDMDINDLPVNLLSGAETEAQHIPKANLALDFTALGSSPRELAASSNGTVQVDLGAGRLENKLLETVSSDLLAQILNALNPFAKKEPYSNLQCAYFDLNLSDGIGELKNLVVQSKKLQILGAGTIDLNNEKLNITFNTKPRAGIGISADMFVTPFVRVAGTLAKPSVGLNKSGAALTTGGAIATGGLSILAQSVADRLTAEVDRCANRSAPASLSVPE